MPAFWTAIAVDSAVMCAALGAIIVGSLAYNPRLWLNDAPPRLRERAEPLSASERRDRWIVATLFFAAIIGVVAWSGLRLAARAGDSLDFRTALAHFVGVFFLFNLFDLVVIDWLCILVLRPAFLKRLSVPGLSFEDTVGGYVYHFRAFVKGMAFVLVMGTIAAVVTTIAAG